MGGYASKSAEVSAISKSMCVVIVATQFLSTYVWPTPRQFCAVFTLESSTPRSVSSAVSTMGMSLISHGVIGALQTYGIFTRGEKKTPPEGYALRRGSCAEARSLTSA